MASHTLDDFLPSESLDSDGDALVAGTLGHLANRTSRRNLLAWIGRASLAVMGGSFLGIWRAEGAWAACGGQGGATTRLSCMCTELIGSNTCPSCCGGFWQSCVTNVNDPAACYGGCPDPGQFKFFTVKLYDCCNSPCSCNFSHPNCSSFGNNTCCNTGYCQPNCNSGWEVKCVRKVCTGTVCRHCISSPELEPVVD